MVHWHSKLLWWISLPRLLAGKYSNNFEVKIVFSEENIREKKQKLREYKIITIYFIVKTIVKDYLKLCKQVAAYSVPSHVNSYFFLVHYPLKSSSLRKTETEKS